MRNPVRCLLFLILGLAAVTATSAFSFPLPPAGPVTGAAMFGGDRPVAEWFSAAGHPVAIARYYALVGEKFGPPWAQSLMAQGTTLLASLDLNRGQTYAQVAAGTYDAQITSWLQGAEAAAVKYSLPQMWVAFEHEANGPSHHPASMGTPAQFVAAWDHMHALAAAAGLNVQQGGRLHWVMILTRRAYYPPPGCCGTGLAAAFYPGAGELDAVGVDGYNRLGCTNGHGGFATGTAFNPPSLLFGPALAFAQAAGLPLMIAEFGSDAYADPNVQAGFITAMKDYVVANPGISAAMYYNGPNSSTTCLYNVFDYPAALAALASMQQALTGRPSPVKSAFGAGEHPYRGHEGVRLPAAGPMG